MRAIGGSTVAPHSSYSPTRASLAGGNEGK
jgi:hypothetical protein